MTENLTELCHRMAQVHDIVLHDPDVDRLVIVERMDDLLVRIIHWLFLWIIICRNEAQPSIAVNLSTSKVLEFIAAKYNAEWLKPELVSPM